MDSHWTTERDSTKESGLNERDNMQNLLAVEGKHFIPRDKREQTTGQNSKVHKIPKNIKYNLLNVFIYLDSP